MIIKVKCMGAKSGIKVDVVHQSWMIDGIDYIKIEYLKINNHSDNPYNMFTGECNFLNLDNKYNKGDLMKLVRIDAYKKPVSGVGSQKYTIISDGDIFLCNDDGQTIERIIIR